MTPHHYKCRWVEAPRTVNRGEMGSEQESLQWREGGSPPTMARGRQGVRQRDPWGTSREGRGAPPCEGSAGGQKRGRCQDPSPRSPGHQGQKSGSVTQAGKQEGVQPMLAGQGRGPVFCWDVSCLLMLETQLPFIKFVRNIFSKFGLVLLPLILF